MSNHVDRLHPRIQAVEPTTGVLTPFFFKWLVQVWERTGGFGDFIADATIQSVEISSSSLAYGIQDDIEDINRQLSVNSDSRIGDLQNQIEDIRRELALVPRTSWNLEEFQLLTTAIAYTTTGKQVITVTSNVTITLNANPADKELAIIKRLTTAGTVTISAGAKTIDGLASYDLITNYECAECMYSYPNNAWIII